MAQYEISHDTPMAFSAWVERVGGSVERQSDFPTEADALDWVGERLGLDIQPAKEA